MEFHRGRLFDHVHLRVRDLEPSRRFYEAALGSLGIELHGGEGYYAAYVLDPDGNNVEAVYHGPARRSAPSIVVTPED